MVLQINVNAYSVADIYTTLAIYKFEYSADFIVVAKKYCHTLFKHIAGNKVSA